MKHSYLPETIAICLLIGVGGSALIGNDFTGVLGPVDSITLESSDGELVITNKDQHLSWGEELTSRVWSVGFVEVGKALSQLMNATHFVDDREELQVELEAQLKEGKEILDGIMEEARALEQDSQEGPAMRQRWEQAYAEFQRLQQLIAETQGALYADQMIEAYQEIVDAVDVVSERMNVDLVLRFIPPDKEFESKNPDATITQIRLRTALKYPEGIDITAEILSELGLDSQ